VFCAIISAVVIVVVFDLLVIIDPTNVHLILTLSQTICRNA